MAHIKNLAPPDLCQAEWLERFIQCAAMLRPDIPPSVAAKDGAFLYEYYWDRYTPFQAAAVAMGVLIPGYERRTPIRYGGRGSPASAE